MLIPKMAMVVMAIEIVAAHVRTYQLHFLVEVNSDEKSK